MHRDEVLKSRTLLDALRERELPPLPDEDERKHGAYTPTSRTLSANELESKTRIWIWRSSIIAIRLH